MAAFDYDIGIIGGGAAGLTVAAGGAQLGAKIVLIEAEPRLGGDCLHYGCVPSKTLIKTARLYHRLQHLERFGLPGVARKPVVFADVARRIKSVIDTIQAHDSVERFCRLGAKVDFGRAAFTDEHSVTVNGRKCSAAKWVIASGSSPAVPHLEGLGQTGFLTNRDIFYLDELPASLLVLGGGPVAIEMAQAFARLGCSVQVVQRSGQILSREDRDMAEAVMDTLVREGIRFHLSTRLLRARQQNGARCLDFENADGTVVSLQAEHLLVALGRSPNIHHMGLEAIGVESSPRGIQVDSRLRTSHKHIFAAGDVTGSYQFTHAAGYEAGVVLSNAIFHLPRKADYTWLPWCTYSDPELASIGMNEKAATLAGIGYSVWTEEFKDNDRALAEGEATGRIKLLLDDTEHPLGVQIFGPHAGELVAEWVGVLNGGVKLSTLAAAVHPYPTLGEINKRVAGTFLSTKLFSKKMRRALAFFFSLKGRACEP